MTDFTRDELLEIQGDHGQPLYYQLLAAFALALLDQNEALRRDKLQLGEERAAEWKRAEKAEAERDEANDERDDAVDRWARRAREAEATCKELLQVQDDRDRLLEELETERVRLATCGVMACCNTPESMAKQRAEITDKYHSWSLESVCAAVCREMRLREENKSLREANEIDLGEKAPLIFENAKLKARNEILREELREAEEAIRLIERITVTYDDARSDGDSERVARVGQDFLDHAAVRRALERAK